MMTKLDYEINQLLNRGVVEIFPSRDKLIQLMKTRPIRLYAGIDPTAPKLHLGHAITLSKLQKFAQLGHEAILVVGTGTVLAGDPSQRESPRPRISKAEIKRNIKNWKKQAAKIVDFSKVKIKYNGQWLYKLNYSQIIDIASHVSALKLFQRDMFQRRIEKGKPIWVHEFLYPLFQGYDSVFLNVDLEIGGTDQTFNMMIGRELMLKMKNKEKFVMTLKMILGIDGYPMSKTRGNCIWLEDSPQEMYGKIMSMPDNLILDYFETLTEISLSEIEKLHPREAKAKLAREIVKLFYDYKTALVAEKEFNRIFREKKVPSHIPEIEIKKLDKINILDLLVTTGLASTKTQARRLVEQGGVKIDNKVYANWQESLKPYKGMVIQVGKRKFIKIK